jgi:signal transduction histidine kinase
MSFDTAQLGKAFQLLMHNSVRFCPTTCNLQVSVFSQSVDHVQVLVADNGVGIRDEYKPSVFEHKMVNGEELGLDYVKAVVEAHDGTISVEDNPGGGTVFVLSFPTGEEEIAEAEVIENE